MALSLTSFGSNALVTNNTTPVTAVAAPGASVFRSVRCVTVYNADTATATVTIAMVVSATTYILQQATIAAGSTFLFGDQSEFAILDNVNKSIVVYLAGSVSANQLHIISNWGDYA